MMTSPSPRCGASTGTASSLPRAPTVTEATLPSSPMRAHEEDLVSVGVGDCSADLLNDRRREPLLSPHPGSPPAGSMIALQEVR